MRILTLSDDCKEIGVSNFGSPALVINKTGKTVKFNSDHKWTLVTLDGDHIGLWTSGMELQLKCFVAWYHISSKHRTTLDMRLLNF